MRKFGLILALVFLIPSCLAQAGGGGGMGYDICLYDSVDIYIDGMLQEFGVQPDAVIIVDGTEYTVPCQERFDINSPCDYTIDLCEIKIMETIGKCRDEKARYMFSGALVGVLIGFMVARSNIKKKKEVGPCPNGITGKKTLIK